MSKKTKMLTSVPKRWIVGGETPRVLGAIDKAMAQTHQNEQARSIPAKMPKKGWNDGR